MALWHGGTQAESIQAKLWKGKRRGGLLQVILPQNLGGAELNHSVTCMVLQPTTGMQLAPCYEEFRRPGSDAVEIRRGNVSHFARVRPQRWDKKDAFHQIPFLVNRANVKTAVVALGTGDLPL
ncbi:hypothetical protein TNCV_3510281 [Trichonephila clavipes]|nr:hypothetical protein TNCV_3510281 [Trichonephila clavipes]